MRRICPSSGNSTIPINFLFNILFHRNPISHDLTSLNRQIHTQLDSRESEKVLDRILAISSVGVFDSDRALDRVFPVFSGLCHFAQRYTGRILSRLLPFFLPGSSDLEPPLPSHPEWKTVVANLAHHRACSAIWRLLERQSLGLGCIRPES